MEEWKPLITVHWAPDKTPLNIWKYPDLNYQHFARVIADLVRHVATAYDVPEDAVWRVVEDERRHPTGEIWRPS